PRIAYPCYKSFDDCIDIDRLKKLDGYLRERVERRTTDQQFHTGEMTLGLSDSRLPGSRQINLTRNKNTSVHNYYELNKAELWEPSEQASEFSEVMDFIHTLPFKTTGRAIIMYDFSGKAVTAHRDHSRIELSHEFIWFRPNLTKPFYMMDRRTGRRKYV